MTHSRKLNNQGFSHIFLPLLFIVIFGIAGSYLLVKSHANSVSSKNSATAQNPKTMTPKTDLAAYPKLTTPVPELATSLVNTTIPEVVSAVHNNDGTTTTTYYDGRAGISSQSLYQELKSNGVPGLVQPTTSDTSTSYSGFSHRIILADAAYDNCTYSDATAECQNGAPVHWQNNGFAHPQIYFVDTTGSKWPINQATYTWNRAQGIDSNYVWKTCPSTRGIHCVAIHEGYYTATQMGGSNVAGKTEVVTTIPANNIVGATIYFSDTASDYNNAYGHREEACHEEGHALGMGHNFSKSSCMYSAILNASSAQYPSNDDYGMLAAIYRTAH